MNKPTPITLHWHPATAQDTRGQHLLLVIDKAGHTVTANRLEAFEREGLTAWLDHDGLTSLQCVHAQWVASLAGLHQQPNGADRLAQEFCNAPSAQHAQLPSGLVSVHDESSLQPMGFVPVQIGPLDFTPAPAGSDGDTHTERLADGWPGDSDDGDAHPAPPRERATVLIAPRCTCGRPLLSTESGQCKPCQLRATP